MAIVSLARYATDAAASFPSTVIRRRLVMPVSSIPRFAGTGAFRRGRHPSQQRTGVTGDDQLFVGRNHPGRDATSGTGDSRALSAIRVFVHLDAEPVTRFTNPLPNLRGVLADAGGEDQ